MEHPFRSPFRFTRATLRRMALVAAASLLLGAQENTCAFSLGPNGLCARLHLGSDQDSIRVGQQLRIEVNAEGCGTIGVCPCLTDALASAQWHSTAPGIATVSGDGVVTALSPGQVEIQLVPEPGAGFPMARAALRVTP